MTTLDLRGTEAQNGAATGVVQKIPAFPKPRRLDPDSEALIFDVQGFSTKDGPGGRTLVFFKGCPLHCWWCCNPESLKMQRSLMFRETDCTKCYECIDRKICPYDAISLPEPGGYPVFDRSKCDRCVEKPCVSLCYHDALDVAGKVYTLDELMRVIERDRRYWGDGGGVTLSGGEMAMQWRFVVNLLTRCQESYIHTAVETASQAPWAHLEPIYEHVDFAFNDIKHMDPAKHREGTGMGNRVILENIRHIADMAHEGKLRQILRIPIIVGFNDDRENIDATADFIRSIGQKEVNILPFHRLGASKYDQLGMVYRAKDMKSPTPEHMDEIGGWLRAKGLRAYVGDDTPF